MKKALKAVVEWFIYPRGKCKTHGTKIERFFGCYTCARERWEAFEKEEADRARAARISEIEEGTYRALVRLQKEGVPSTS